MSEYNTSPEVLSDGIDNTQNIMWQWGNLEQLRSDVFDGRKTLDHLKSLEKPAPHTGGVDTFGDFLRKAGVYPLLNKDQEKDLSILREKGSVCGEHTKPELITNLSEEADEVAVSRGIREMRLVGKLAKQAMIHSNLRLVVNIAKRYPVSETVSILDHTQNGALGLEHAVDKFDWRKGFKFSTYATFWIGQAVSRGIDYTSHTIRIPPRMSALAREAHNAAGSIDAIPDTEMLHINRLMHLQSFDAPIYSESNTEYGELLASSDPEPEPMAIVSADVSVAQKIIANMPPEQRYIIEARYGIGQSKSHGAQSLEGIAKDIGQTPRYVAVMEKKALALIREQLL